MDWHNEEDLCAFVLAVKEHHAHSSETGVGGKESKWECVRKDLVRAFPTRQIQAAKSLSRRFLIVRKNVSDKFSVRSNDMSNSEPAMFDLIEESESRTKHIESVLQDREAAIASTMQNIQSNESAPLFQCRDDAIIVAALQVLRIAKVHQLEEGITLTAKWELALKMLARILPSSIMLISESNCRDRMYPSYMKAIAAKFGTSGISDDQAGLLLESEKLACQMLAEANTTSKWARCCPSSAVRISPKDVPEVEPSAMRADCNAVEAQASASKKRKLSEADFRKTAEHYHAADKHHHVPVVQSPATSTTSLASADAFVCSPTPDGSATHFIDNANHNVSGAGNNADDHQLANHRKQKKRKHGGDLDARAVLKKLKILGNVAKLQLEKEVTLESKRLDLEGKRLEMEIRRLEVEGKQTDVDYKRLDVEARHLEIEGKRLDVELERIKLQKMQVASN